MLGTVIGIYKPAMVTFLPFSFAITAWNEQSTPYHFVGVSLDNLQVTWLSTDLFTVLLGFLMLSMGLTLTFEDFRRCLRNPWTVCFCILVIFVFYIQLRSNI